MHFKQGLEQKPKPKNQKPQFSNVCMRGNVSVRYWHANCIFAFNVGVCSALLNHPEVTGRIRLKRLEFVGRSAVKATHDQRSGNSFIAKQLSFSPKHRIIVRTFNKPASVYRGQKTCKLKSMIEPILLFSYLYFFLDVANLFS